MDENQIKKIDVNERISDKIKLTIKNLEKLEDIKFNYENEEENKKFKEIITIIENWKKTYENFEKYIKDIYSKKTNQLELRKVEKEKEEIIKQIKNEKKFEKKLQSKLLKKLEDVKTNDEMIIAKKNINQLIKDSKNKFNQNTRIIFPIMKVQFFNDEQATINQKIIESLIKYNIYDKIAIKMKKDSFKFSALNELESYEEIKSLVNTLSNYIWSNLKNKKIILEYIEDFRHNLKANLINEIINIEPEYLNMNKIRDMLNSYIKRIALEEQEIFWCNEISVKYYPTFELNLPEFDSYDIKALFYRKSKKNENENENENYEGLEDENDPNSFIENGIYIKNNKIYLFNGNNFYKKIYNLKDLDLYNIKDTLHKIFYIYMETLNQNKIDKNDNLDNYLSNNDFIKKMGEKLESDGQRKILNLIKKLYDNLSIKREEIDLNYEDLFFLNDEDWLNNKKNIYKKYPSLVFYLLKYPNIQREFKHDISLIKYSNKNFPLFLHFLRIYSSENCLVLDVNSNYFISKKISEELKNKIAQLKLNENFNLNCMGLLTKINLGKNLISEKIDNLYKYLYNLSNLKENPDKLTEIYISDLIESLIKALFDNINNIENLFSQDIQNKDINYISKISKLLGNRLDELQNKDNINAFFLNEIEKINTLYQNNNKIIDDLIDSIKKDIKEFKKNNEEKEMMKQKNLLSQRIESLNENVKKYRNLYDKVKEREFMDLDKLSESCVELNTIENKIKDEGNIFNEEDKLILFSYKLPEDKKYSYIIIIDEQSLDLSKLETFYKYYEDSEKKDILLISEKNNEKNLKEIEIKYEKSYFYNIDDHKFKLKKNEIKSTKINQIKINPKIIINEEEIDEEFEKSKIIKDFDEALKKLDNILKNISKNINKIRNSKNDFEDINKKFKNINFSSPKIEGDKPKETDEICQKIDKFKIEILNLFDNILNKYEENKKFSSIINQDKKMIPKDFDLLDLNINIINLDKIKLGFSDNINDINISLPYLFYSHESNSLIFCLNKLT